MTEPAADPGLPSDAAFRGLFGASRRYRRLRSGERFFRELTQCCWPGAVVLLTFVFLSRVLWPPLAWAALALPLWVVLVAARVLAGRRWALHPWQADALADLHSRSRGTFMAIEEVGTGPDGPAGAEWADRLGRAPVRVPVHFPWGHAAHWAAGALLLTVLLLLPDLRPGAASAGAATTPLDRMGELVATLREEELTDQDYLQDAEQMLEAMRQQATQSLGTEDWQALDEVRDNLMRQLTDAQRQAEQNRAQFAAYRSALANRLTPDAEKMARLAARMAGDEEAMKRLREAAESEGMTAEGLAELMARCSNAGSSALSQQDLQMLQALLGETALTPDQMAQLAQMLEGMDLEALAGICRGMGLEGMTAEELAGMLARAKMGRPAFGKEDLDALMAVLDAAQSQCDGTVGFCADMLTNMGGRPGRGGISRGPGPATLTGSEDTPTDLGAFQDEAFTGNRGDERSPLGYSFTPPDESDVPEGAAADGTGPAIEFGAGNERITWHSRLLPRHTDVMDGYFSEPTGKEPD